MKTLTEEIKERMISNLENMEGIEVYGCDLGYSIFESENINCTATYSTYKAREWIKEYFNELGEVVEHMNSAGYNIPNVFDEPEQFMVQVMLEYSYAVIAKCSIVDENWNEEVTLDEKAIKLIVEQVNEVDEYNLF